ncbi:O-methyltransferase-like protein [Fibrisoma limi BUZ 3]|uniref:O-methyltransferase-like protein n=1 Tax=Fibrisoma limi BUZ 3 TaxID=1185876 RepID=I2GNE5_9BACT|nr:class I SAM-dependent methyltransferase [Fibrisoma limi]CCH55423.1 O-methyltransferase-like protein [Fibrisoma limi BUZ 3]
MIPAYLRYLLNARDEHALHSPFLFKLYTEVIRVDNRNEPAFAAITSLRQSLLRRSDSIEITDFGAGSRVRSSPRRMIRDIVRTAEKPARFARLLYRLIQRFHARSVVELGTSLGVTTAYLADAAALTQGRVLTFEGCPQTAAVAQQNLLHLNAQNVDVIVGNLDDTLAPSVATLEHIDLAFFDANHRFEPTVRYFETCLTKAHNDTVFIFDDIHWSAEMEQAWAYIKAHSSVSVTIDLFWIGLVFFRREQPKQNFTLRF